MAQKPAAVSKTMAALQQLAASYPGVEVAIACAGTALESSSFKVARKSFLFLRPAELMVKLDASMDEARANAQSCKVGATGWVTVRLDEQSVPIQQLKRWIEESYQLFATKPSTKKPKKKKT